MEKDLSKITFPNWVLWSAGVTYLAGSIILLVGKLFYFWPVDSVALILFLFIWIPFILPLVRRLKYKDLEIEFMEMSVKQVQADVATLKNQTEIMKDQTTHALQDIKIDPYKIRIKYTSKRVDERYFRVNLWLDAPPEFLSQVETVTYERHPSFKKRFKETRVAPFEDTFKCWGEFTIKAKIQLKNRVSLHRQKYLALIRDQEVDDGDDLL